MCGGSHGRPAGAWPAFAAPTVPLHFSVSRRGGDVVVALAQAPVGVDLEAIPGEGGWREAAALLHPDEQVELAAGGPAERAAACTRLWVRKQAYLKGTGAGIAHGLDGVYVGDRPGHPDAPVGWAIDDVALVPGFAAATAVRI